MSLERRQELITKVVRFEGKPSDYFEELRKFGWDCDKELVILTENDIRNVLSKYSAGEITEDKLREWANFIERRDDIVFDRDKAQILDEVVFWLANPEINYPINARLVQRIDEAFEVNGI